MTAYWCELAWLGGPTAATGVIVDVTDDRIGSITTGVTRPPAGAERLDGLTLPGLANAHSHAFHRALRGRTQTGSGDFFTWREQMYRAAGRLTPAGYQRLARATFAEMVEAGVSVVGEFHYVHHRADGTPHPDANAMAEALMAAAEEVGVRLTLIDTCYLHGGIGTGGYEPLADAQRRFGGGTVDSWVDRVDRLATRVAGAEGVTLAVAAHSVRAVDPTALAAIGGWAEDHHAGVHLHLSEQPVENDQCLALHGCTPTELLHAAGLLSPRLTAVHATHLSGSDIESLGSVGAGVCFCPTTERDLADGIGASVRLAAAGSPLCLGSDSQATIDLLAEAAALEHDQRLATGRRGNHPVPELLDAATVNGYRALGWPDGGSIAPGRTADLVTVGLDSARLAGLDPDSVLAGVVFGGSADDVNSVVIGGRRVVTDGRHLHIDVAGELRSTIEELMS
ncbi:MAG: formimidoylglutamate deiminase [Acidimicrobiales bacterium]